MAKRILTTALLLFTISFTGFAQVDAEYTKALKKMFKVMGTEETFQTSISQMFNMYKQQYPQVDTEIWTEFEKEFTKTSLDDLTKMLAPVYKKHLTIDDVKEITKFYESPVGKKMAKSNPMIIQESMLVGQEWGMKIGQKFEAKMKEKGF